MTGHPYRPVNIAHWDVEVRTDTEGAIRVHPLLELGPYPERLTDSLDYWAVHAPDRVFLAKRDPRDRHWRTLTYAEFRRLARNAAAWLPSAGLTAEQPIVILSGNDLEHAILAVAAMYAGIPYAPISPAYSLMSSDFAKLRHIFELLKPGLVFVSDMTPYRKAIDAVVPPSTPVVATADGSGATYRFEELTATAASDDVRFAPAVNGDTIAKILFTSGSTGIPKGVINTQRMLCSNQEMLRTVFPVLAETPPVICDWLPWNHTFGGNHNFGLVLYNGGTLYIDDGRPVGRAFQETLDNLREIAPTVYFNVPKGYEALVDALRDDAALRQTFFSRLSMTFYAAAGLSQHIWDALDELAVATCGQRIAMLTGLGATETAPFAICANKDTARAGVVGLPVPGVELKLVPQGRKLEVRLRGPNVTPGFWAQPETTRAAFDDEGYYRLGDALRFLDPNDLGRGFVFDGRIAEDFKLSTGTWVSVGPLRARFLLHAAPHIRDVVFAGQDRDDLTALLVPDTERPPTSETVRALLQSFAADNPGSSTRIARAIVLAEPPSLDAGEVTDKGSINQSAVLERRRALIDLLYTNPPPPEVIAICSKKGAGL